MYQCDGVLPVCGPCDKKTISCSYTSDPTLSRSAALKVEQEQLQTKYDSLLHVYAQLKGGSMAEESALLEMIRKEEDVPEVSGFRSMRVLPEGNIMSTERASK
jgi:hypothetical protein